VTIELDHLRNDRRFADVLARSRGKKRTDEADGQRDAGDEVELAGQIATQRDRWTAAIAVMDIAHR
jgi:hypothetical protein